MKKGIITLLIILLMANFIPNLSWTRVSANQGSISSKVIRFHVIANSDTDQDQNLKLKVRDAALQYLYPKLKTSKNIEESRKILKQNTPEIMVIARKLIKDNGYSYPVSVSLTRENFPMKSYGNITLPQGNYEAYRIIIGTGQGHNWWCVMFPPLCFVDITKGEVSEKQTQKEMKKVLTEDEYKLVDNTEIPKSKEKVIFKFKLVELFHKLIK